MKTTFFFLDYERKYIITKLNNIIKIIDFLLIFLSQFSRIIKVIVFIKIYKISIIFVEFIKKNLAFIFFRYFIKKNGFHKNNPIIENNQFRRFNELKITLKNLLFKIRLYFHNYQLSYKKLSKNLIYGLLFIFLGEIAVLTFASRLEKENGIRTVNILTSSMYPAISPGSIVVTSPQSEYNMDDVITYKIISPKTGHVLPSTITHRIIDIKKKSNEKYFITKGDFNKAPDPYLINKHLILGKVVLVIPLMGYIFSSIKTLPGFISLIIIPAFALVVEQFNYIRDV